METVGVIGTGTMGHGIAQIAAMSGYRVILCGRRKKSIEDAVNKIKLSLQKFAKKGAIKEEEMGRILDRITATTSLNEELSDTSIVIEAISEDIEVKKNLYAEIEKKISEDTIISSTTSSIPISVLQKGLEYPSRVIGTHFFNPPQIMKLVEIMMGNHTSYQVLNRCISFISSLGKVPLILRREIPGYVVNRILLRMFLTAIEMVESGEASPIEVDYLLKNRCGLPMGLFELADFVGLDVVNNSLKILCRFDNTFKSSTTIEKMVKEGRLGMKALRGFYEYSENGERDICRHINFEKYDAVGRIILAGVRAADELIDMGIVDRESIDLAVKLGLNFSKGIYEYAELARGDIIEGIILR